MPFFGDWRHELAKLDVTHLWKTAPRIPFTVEYCQGNRNRASFCYALRLFKHNPTLPFEDLLFSLESFQQEQSAPPLSRTENAGILKSVLRNAHRYGDINPNRGILGLPPKPGFLSDADYWPWRSERHSAGAAYARQKRTEDRKSKIAEAAASLRQNGAAVTVSAVARMIGVSRNTVQKYLLS